MIKNKEEIDELILDLADAYSAVAFSYKVLHQLEDENLHQVYINQILSMIDDFRQIENSLVIKLESYQEECRRNNLPTNLIYHKLLRNFKNDPL